MENVNITSRQKKILKMIIKEFINSGIPIGSKKLVEKYNLNYSSATIRNEMLILEKKNLLEKAHQSSGRVPTTLGYDHYVRNIDNLAIESNLKRELNKIFSKRLYSIDQTIDEAVRLISKTTDLTLVTVNHETNELMKSIQLVPLNENNATIVFVTSTGRVFSKLLEVNSLLKINDIQIAVRLFRDRLKNTPLKDLGQKISSLAPLLKNSISNFEYLLQQFVKKVFNFHNKMSSKIYGRSNIIKKNQFETQEKLFYIMKLLDDKSIWNSINATAEYEEDNLRINLSDNGVTVISQEMIANNVKHEISVVGSRRMQYGEILSILNYLAKMIEGKTPE